MSATATATNNLPRLKARYNNTIKAQLAKDLGIENPMQIPKLDKIVINMGVGEAVNDRKKVDAAAADLALIAGQKPVITRSKKSIAVFKLREGMAIESSPAICPLRMRVSISPKGSLNAIFLAPRLPAGLDDAGQMSGGGQLAQCNARQFHLAVHAASPSRELAAVPNPRLRSVARQFGELHLRREPFLDRLRPILGNRLQRTTLGIVLLGHLDPALVLLDRAGLSHGTGLRLN